MNNFYDRVIEDRYSIVKPLSKSKKTEVFLATRIADGVKVVIKKTLDSEESYSGISRIANEFNILKDLSHKGIPKVYETLYFGGSLALVEEFAAGQSLKEKFLNSSASNADFFNVSIQLVDILAHLHSHGVIHKNINPGNVIIQNDGSVKLIDFAISSNHKVQSTDTRNIDQIEGWLSYISPEQTGRTAYSVSFSSDFYSLGILLYELLAGKPPFDSVDPLEVIHFHLSRNPIALSSILETLPEGLEKIIIKLMHKNPEDRYQTVAGLKSDLEIIQEHYIDQKPLRNFKAGRNDSFRHYKPNQKLYGREDEVNALLAYFNNLDQYRSIWVLVSGYSGVGKSALIKHIKYPIIQQNGLFLSGKFDQFKKDIPYYAFIEAVREFIHSLMAESDEVIQYWRDRILSALRENADLITEVIPSLTKIIGIQEPVPKLQPAEQEARFNMVLLDFIYVFTSKDSPLVIFLDDLQWADLSSLSLVKRIVDNPRDNYIMILGAYRENEVDKSHPLNMTFNQLNAGINKIKTLRLKPLGKETTCQITADSFAMNPDKANDIGKLVFEKTKGNPFFITNFLKTLYDRNILKTDREGQWIWDRSEIEGMSYTANVIDLMTERMNELPDTTLEVLKNAAVLGNTFYLTDLNKILDQSPVNICNRLKPAIDKGYVFSNDQSYRALTLNEVHTDLDTGRFLLSNKASFTFCHDKVQQAAYGFIRSHENAQIQLKIGRLLLAHRNESDGREGIFELLNLFSHGIHLIDDQEERHKLATLCLTAGRKAKDSTSYGLGVRFLEMGKMMFESEPWISHYNLTYDILLELGECEYLDNNPGSAEKYFKEILAHARTNFDKLKVYYLHSSLYLKMGNTLKSLQLGRDAMKLYNIRFPTTKNAIRIRTLRTLVKYLFLFSTRYRNPETLLKIEDCENEEIIAINKFLIDLATSAYQQDKNLMMLVIFEIIKSYLKHGFTDASGFGFSGFSVVVLSSLNLQKRGFNLWDLTIKLHNKTQSPLIKWRLSYTVLCFHNPWRYPFKDSYSNVLETIKACVLNGDQIFTGYTVALYLRMRLMAGDNLDSVLESSDDQISLIRDVKGGFDYFQGFYQLAKALNGRTHRGTWNDDSFNGEYTLRRLEKEDNHTKLALHHASKTAMLYFYGQYNKALIESDRTFQYMDNALGDLVEAWHAFFTSLTISAMSGQLEEEERKLRLKEFKKHFKNMKYWARGCPQNFRAHYLVMKAEWYVMENKPGKALHHYEKAIKNAVKNKIPYVEAIANEQAALISERMHFDRRLQSYVNDAWEAWKLWGAEVKCQQIESNYPAIIADRSQPDSLSVSGVGGETVISSQLALDLGSLIKASESIARQVRYHDLLKTLMHIIIENAGADKGCFLISRDGQLFVEALGVSGQKGVEILDSEPLNETSLLPRTFINYCWRSKEILVVDDALKDNRFGNDPYVVSHKIASMMCLPIVAMGKSNGVLFLENSLLRGVFDKNRLNLLKLLSGQIGISLDNALLYENLEEKVVERTKEIEKTLEELKATQDQLIHSEKMASLGELTAGIAHEIQNPLNFVNNFSEVSSELLDEMMEELEAGNMDDVNDILNDIQNNLHKINHHGKRADGIVKGMLHHSRSGSGQKESTDLNELCDEYLRLAYHGLRAKDKSFNAYMETDFDPSLPKVDVIPQDMGRVLLNLITNAFYAVTKASQIQGVNISSIVENQKQDDSKDHATLRKSTGGKYRPTVKVSTKLKKKISSSHEGRPEEDGRDAGEEYIEISVSDNGTGIPDKVVSKIFQPFFTTKPTGQGTGLGLSMSYDIITKGHGGELLVETQEKEGTTFTIKLPK